MFALFVPREELSLYRRHSFGILSLLLPSSNKGRFKGLLGVIPAS